MTSTVQQPGVDDLPLVGVGVDQVWPRGVVRAGLVAQRAGFEVWSGTSAAHGAVSVVVLGGGAIGERMVRAARRSLDVEPAEGVLAIHEVGPEWIVTSSIVGYAIDLPALGWKLDRKLALVADLAEALGRLHEMGVVHGALCPANVALDAGLRPVLSEMGALDPAAWRSTAADSRSEHIAYAAPEVRAGEPATVASDVYALGRLVAFVLTGEAPPVESEAMPRLEYLKRSPAGLSRIVRRATVADPQRRYANVAELAGDLARYGEYESVGLAHAESREENLSGLSGPPRSPGTANASCSTNVEIIVAPAASPGETRRASRAIAAAVLVVFVAVAVAVFFHPVRAIASYRARRELATSAPRDRGAVVAKLVSLGDRSFDDVQLAGADLSRLALVGVSFVAADLQRARLDGTDLAGADFSRARLAGMSALGADLTGVELAHAAGARSVLCDEATVTPPGWRCTSGLLAPDGPGAGKGEAP